MAGIHQTLKEVRELYASPGGKARSGPSGRWSGWKTSRSGWQG